MKSTVEPHAPPEEAAQDRAVEAPASWLWHPPAIVFVSNTCIMVLELVAGRMIAPYVGVSLYTWTSVIGVVLAGISLGNFLGGQAADRWASLRLLGAIFVVGGLSAFSILWAEDIGYRLPKWPLIGQILLMTAALFFIPSMVLGAVSPLVAKLAVRDLRRTGSTLGGIYAAGTVGSIVGTFGTGFILISQFGTRSIVWGVAVVLLGLGALLIAGSTKRMDRAVNTLVALVLVAGAAFFVVWRGTLASRCTRETNYYCIRVQTIERGQEKLQELVLDHLVHSYTSLTNPFNLEYGYEKIFAEIAQYQAQRQNPPSALFIGGGGYTFPQYLVARFPGAQVRVIEIDPGVTQIAHDMLGLEPDTSIQTFNEDARLFMTRQPDRKYAMIIGDAFNDFSVPYHLTTKGFNDRVRAWLEPGGLYMVNLIDGYRGDFVRSYMYTLRQSFRYVYFVPGSSDWRNLERMTHVVIASDTALDTAAFASIDAGDGWAQLSATLLPDAGLDALLAEGRTIAITDDYAPVEQMLSSMVRSDLPPATPVAGPTAVP